MGEPVLTSPALPPYALLPFNQAMGSLKAHRSDIFEVIGTRLPDPTTVRPEKYRSLSASVLLSDVSLYQRTTGDGLPRVMIVGDSQALSLGYGLDRWSAANQRALVWNHGIEGCGVGVEGETRTFGSTVGPRSRCRAVNAWPGQLKAFKPDVVIVLSSLTDIQDRKLPGSSKFSSIGDPTFDSFLTKGVRAHRRHAVVDRRPGRVDDGAVHRVEDGGRTANTNELARRTQLGDPAEGVP